MNLRTRPRVTESPTDVEVKPRRNPWVYKTSNGVIYPDTLVYIFHPKLTRVGKVVLTIGWEIHWAGDGSITLVEYSRLYDFLPAEKLFYRIKMIYAIREDVGSYIMFVNPKRTTR